MTSRIKEHGYVLLSERCKKVPRGRRRVCRWFIRKRVFKSKDAAIRAAKKQRKKSSRHYAVADTMDFGHDGIVTKDIVWSSKNGRSR